MNDDENTEQTEWECPVHGNIGKSAMRFELDDSVGGKLNKAFCFRCVVDKLVEVGVSEVTAIPPDKE